MSTQVSKAETSICERFKVTEFPTIIALPPGANGPGDRFTGTVGYKSIDMFLWKFENKLKKQSKDEMRAEL
eukprot:734642-Prorocentrum_minimum.AAC.1